MTAHGSWARAGYLPDIETIIINCPTGHHCVGFLKHRPLGEQKVRDGPFAILRTIAIVSRIAAGENVTDNLI